MMEEYKPFTFQLTSSNMNMPPGVFHTVDVHVENPPDGFIDTIFEFLTEKYSEYQGEQAAKKAKEESEYFRRV